MARIKLPHEAFGTFIRAANSWLSKSIDAKTALEIRLANQAGSLHVSAGADANYIEAVLKVDAKDIEALSQPIFLDIPTLAAYDYDSDELTMVVPQTEKEDQRITFSVPGMNFRVPRKKGEIWRRNFFDLKEEKADGLILDKVGFEKLWKHLELPNSFKTDRKDFQVCFDISPLVGYKIHGYDGFGAFCHTFKDEKTQGKPDRMVFIEDFFTPCKEFKVDSHISFGISERQCFGEFKAQSSGIEMLRWTQPRYQKRPNDIPRSIQEKRLQPIVSLTVSPRELGANLARVCMLLSPAEMRSVPVEFEVVANQYSLVTKKPSGEGEVRAEGTLLESASKNMKLNVQALCWKDYLSQFEPRAAVTMEVVDTTALLSQSLEDRELIYWMPLLPSTGRS